MTKKRKNVIIKVVLVVLILVFIGVCTIGAIISSAPSLDLMDVTPEGYLTTVVDEDGDEILSLAGVEANRVYVTLDEIPEDLQHAFVAIEDERFYVHHGIDPRGIIRAAFKGVTSGHLSQGASTITQQLIKNNVFSGWTNEGFIDKVCRKLQEQYLAIRLEREQSKEWILENYLNTMNLGSGTWGVQAASNRYFGKSVSGLTLSESAMIAGITKNPSAYSPLKNPEKAKERQETVLQKMSDNEYITEEQMNEALADDILTRIEQNHTDNSANVFSYFEDSLLREVVTDLMKDNPKLSEEEAWEKVYRGGLTIFSTQDTAMQRKAEEYVNTDRFYASDAQSSLVLLDVESGAVKAIVGGRGKKEASLTMNRATDSIRQPGSTIKIIGEYADALDKGAITLGSVYDDAPTGYSDGTPVRNASGRFGGKTTIREAIEVSLNTVALQVFQQEGTESVLSRIQDFGITTLNESDKIEALALGGTTNGVTNLEMTAAYNALANDGVYIEPYFYTRVLDHDGNILLEKNPEMRQVVSEGTARLLTQAMRDVITQGTGGNAYFNTTQIAGKSGTTTDIRDIWFVGYSPDVCCGVWGGFDDNSEQTASNYVQYFWKSMMKSATEEYGWNTFSTEGLTTAVICSKCGKRSIDGLCNRTKQGDMEEVVYFSNTRQPGGFCDCHEELRICTVSNMLAGNYCPEEDVRSGVYLRFGTKGTEDEDYVVPAHSEEKCTEHTSFWSQIFGNGNTEDNPDDSYDDPGSSWWNDIYNESSNYIKENFFGWRR